MERPAKIVVLVGLPGCGKSTWLAGRPGVLASDTLREVLSDDAANQNIHRRVFHVLRELLKHRLELRMPVTYIDATNLTARERRPYLKLSELYDCEIEAVYFDVPLAECQQRNRSRARMVPEAAISEMAARMVVPTTEEGFARVLVVT